LKDWKLNVATTFEKSYVRLDSRSEQLRQLLSESGQATIEAVGRRVVQVAKQIVPVRTGALQRSIQLNVLHGNRGGASISTGAGERGFHYGALVEGSRKPFQRNYKSTPFEAPAFERVMTETESTLRQQTENRAGRMEQ
jgi:hypothetical protein